MHALNVSDQQLPRPTLDVSVIVTVLNEAASLPAFLPGLLRQTFAPQEIIVCDGGSADATLALLSAWQSACNESGPSVQILTRPGCNISQGRNAAIQAARCAFIAVTDAGIRLEPDWLEQLVRVMERHRNDADVQGVAGFSLPEAVGPFETALAGTTQPFRQDIDAETFLPAGRSMLFRRAAWQAVNGFPDWLDYCEDLVFDQQVEGLAGGRKKAMPLAPFSVVRVRPRPNLKSFCRQYFLYARGDGKADLHGRRHLVRYAAYGALMPCLARLLLSPKPGRRLVGWLVGGAGALGYCWRPLARVRQLGRYRLSARQMAVAWLWVPWIRLAGDMAKMAGYPLGWFWRIRHWRRAEIHWRMSMRIRAKRPPVPAARLD